MHILAHIFILSVIAIIVGFTIYNKTDNLFWFGVGIVGVIMAVALITPSFLVPVQHEFEKLPHDKIEVTKTDNHVFVIDHKGRHQKFDTKKDYEKISDTTTFYYKKVYNSWGGRLTSFAKEELVPEYKKEKNDE